MVEGGTEDWALWAVEVVEQLPGGVTLIGLDGRLRYYNREAARILDRKPEYIGRDVAACHAKQESVERIRGMIRAFEQGRKEPFHWEIERFGRRLLISFSPLGVEGRLLGCIHMAVVKPS